MCGFEKSRLFEADGEVHLFAARILGNSFCPFADGVLRQFSGQEKSHGSLDFARSNGRLLVVLRQTRSLSCDLSEDVINEGVHDRHGFARDSDIGVNLLQDFVDVN